MAGTPASSTRGGFPLGLAGAVSPTRYVGGTADLAPTTGTFAAGDYVVSLTGKVWVCTVAGTPGTWTQAGGAASAVKDYVQVTSPVSITATSEGTAQVLVTGTSLVWDGTTRYMFEYFSPEWNASSTTAALSVILFDGTGVVGYMSISRAFATAVPLGSISGMYPFTPAAGTRAYSVRAFSSAANTSSIGGGAGGGSADVPMFLRVMPF